MADPKNKTVTLVILCEQAHKAQQSPEFSNEEQFCFAVELKQTRHWKTAQITVTLKMSFPITKTLIFLQTLELRSFPLFHRWGLTHPGKGTWQKAQNSGPKFHSSKCNVISFPGTQLQSKQVVITTTVYSNQKTMWNQKSWVEIQALPC